MVNKKMTQIQINDYIDNHETTSTYLYVTDDGNNYQFNYTTWNGKYFFEVRIDDDEIQTLEVDEEYHSLWSDDPMDQLEVVDRKGVVLRICPDCNHFQIIYTHDGEEFIRNPLYDWD